MTTATATDRGRMAEACEQAANLYDTLARDRITRGTAAALRSAAQELSLPPGHGAPAPAPAPPSAAPSDELVMVVSALIALRDRVPGGWFIDDETMTRLERAHAPHQAAALIKARKAKGLSRDD